MHKLSVIALLAGLFLGACTHSKTGVQRKGDKLLGEGYVQVDSILIDADTTSLRGTFHMMDSSFVFLDNYYCKVYLFSLADGQLREVFSQYGQGPNDMVGVMEGGVVHPADTSLWVINSSLRIYDAVPCSKTVTPKGQLGFLWG